MTLRQFVMTGLMLTFGCGNFHTQQSSLLQSASTNSAITVAILPTSANQNQVELYASFDSSLKNISICSLQSDNSEACFPSTSLGPHALRQLHRVTNPLPLSPDLRLVVKAQTINGSEVKRPFSLRPVMRPSPNPSDPQNNNLPPLPSDKGNFNLTSSTGQKTTLKELFTTPYMLIEASSPGCPGCLQMAQIMNGNSQNATQIHNLLNGTKCSKAILVSGLSTWLRSFPANTFVGKSSYSTERSPMEVLRSFGFNGSAIPAFILVDRNFKIIDSGVGSLPQEMYNLCR